MATTPLTYEHMRVRLNYEPSTGVFTWLTGSHKVKAGSIAGGSDATGYQIIKVNSKSYKAHRLAWLYVYKMWPTEHIDHINGVKGDNRIENLREVSPEGNCQNIRNPYKRNTTGLLGVSWNKAKGKYTSSIQVKGRQTHLGSFATKAEAYNAYLLAKRALHPFNTL